MLLTELHTRILRGILSNPVYLREKLQQPPPIGVQPPLLLQQCASSRHCMRAMASIIGRRRFGFGSLNIPPICAAQRGISSLTSPFAS